MRWAAPAAAIAALLLAACSSPSAPPDTPSPSTASPPGGHGSLAECLGANGVTGSDGVPAVLGPPAGVDQNTWDEAMKACSTLAPGPTAP